MCEKFPKFVSNQGYKGIDVSSFSNNLHEVKRPLEIKNQSCYGFDQNFVKILSVTLKNEGTTFLLYSMK